MMPVVMEKRHAMVCLDGLGRRASSAVVMELHLEGLGTSLKTYWTEKDPLPLHLEPPSRQSAVNSSLAAQKGRS